MAGNYALLYNNKGYYLSQCTCMPITEAFDEDVGILEMHGHKL
jgi:hypothetical protein